MPRLSFKKVSLTRLGEVLDLLGHGGGEEQRLALGLKVGEDCSDVLLEAHVDHSVWKKSLQALRDKLCETSSARQFDSCTFSSSLAAYAFVTQYSIE